MEMMVVVGVLSLLAVLAIPRLGQVVGRAQGEQAAKAVSSLITSAQAKARAQEKPYAVLLTAPSNNTPGSAVLAVNAEGAWTPTGERVSLPPGTRVSPSQATIAFDDRGVLDAGSPSRVIIGRRTLTITRWGEVSMQ